MAPLGPWGIDRRVAVAVSGGSDSLCLAWLAAGWGKPMALIVDHGLRAESAEEAVSASARLARFGVESRILRVEELARGPGLPARARRARYAALAKAAASEGLADVLLGHHAGDQAETLLIRAESGSGPAGLAGMDSIVETPSLRLVRPLLGVMPERLRATLIAEGIGWSEDPSNANPMAARTRMRTRLAKGEQPAPDCCREASQRTAAEDRLAGVLASRVAVFPEGYALLTPGPLESGGLAALIRAVSGSPYPARTRALARLSETLRGTLGGVRFLPAGRMGTGTLAVREAAALAPPIDAAPGAMWDRRFLVAASGSLPGDATIGAVGDDAVGLRRRTALPDPVLRTLPALRARARPLAVPHLGMLDGWTNAGIRLTFRPANPVAGAAFGLGDAQRALDHHVLNKASSARLLL